MTPIIIADRYIEQVCKALGLPLDLTQRIIIDAQVGEPVRVYHQSVGDEELLTFTPTRVEEAKINE